MAKLSLQSTPNPLRLILLHSSVA